MKTTRFRNWVVAPAADGRVMCFISTNTCTVVYVDTSKSHAENCAAIARTVSINPGEYGPLVEHVLGGLEK